MLEYSIQILEKVSFEPVLFSKELQKAIHILTPSEIQKLGKWFLDYSKSHTQLVSRIQNLFFELVRLF